MSDEIPDLDELPDALEHESDPDSPINTKPREVTESERLSRSLGLDARRIESADIEDQLASEHARQVLQDDIERLYRNDLDINNPPDSIEAFEQRVTLRNLAAVAIDNGSPEDVAYKHREIIFDIDAADVDNGVTEGSVKSFSDMVTATSEPVNADLAKKTIDRMKEYGPVAEQFLSIVTAQDIHPEIASYALDALADIQEQPTEQQSLVETLRQWWGGE